MKSFLDRFRRKGGDRPPDGGRADSTQDAAREAAKAFSPALLKKREAPDKPEPAPAGSASGSGIRSAERSAPAPAVPQREETVTFDLDDFLHRIPEKYLKPGPHDGTQKLTFDVQELSSRIARGQTTLALSEIHKRVPKIFRQPVSASDETEIRFPWQKLLELVKAATSNSPRQELTDSAAEALAAKLRNRRRNIVPGAAAAAAAAAEKPEASSGAQRRSIPGQPSWFSRPAATPSGSLAGSEESVTKPAVPAPAAPAEPPPPPAPAAAADPQPETKRATLAKALPQEEWLFVPNPREERASAPGAESRPEDLERIAALEKEIAAARAERDETESALQLLETTLAEQTRDLATQKERLQESVAAASQSADELVQARALLAELESGSKGGSELQSRIDEQRVELEKRESEFAALRGQIEALRKDSGELAAARAEAARLAAIESDKAALAAQVEEQRAGLDERSKELETLRREIDDIRRATEDKLADATQERGALLAQKTHLTEQIAQMQKGVTARTDAAAGEGERSRKEYQRQLDEYQRRIGALETSQKESAQELGREREAKIKAERAASAAERARSEATALVESIRSDMRREGDAQSRKRDAESARLQKELSEKIDSLTDAHRKAVSERDELAAEVAALRKAAQEKAAEDSRTVDADWESRAVSSLEADIENYRTRVRALLKERDALVKDKEQLIAGAGDSEALAEQKISNEKLTADFEALRGERDRLQQQFAGTDEKLARAESGASIAIAAHEQRTAAELNQLKAEVRKHREEREGLARAGTDAGSKVAELEKQLAEAKAAAIAPEKLAHAEAEAARLGRELEEAKAAAVAPEKLAHAEAEAARLGRELEEAKAAAVAPEKLAHAEAEAARLKESLAAAESATVEKLAAALAERDAARKDQAALKKRLKELDARHSEALEKGAALQETQDRAADLAARLASITGERDVALRKHEDFTRELTDLKAEMDRKVSDRAEGEANGNARANEAAAPKLAAAAAQFDTVTASLAALEERLCTEKADREALRTRAAQLEAGLDAARKAASAQDDELARQARQHEAALTELAAKKDAALAEAAAGNARTAAALTKERDDLAARIEAERAVAERTASTREKEFAREAAVVVEERDAARRESAAVAQRLAALGVENDRKLEIVRAQLEVIGRERAVLASELEAARETCDSQSGVFSRELKTVTKQRDDAALDAGNSRNELDRCVAQFDRERAAFERAIDDIKARNERDGLRLRQERDTLVRQRDELRARLSRMVEEQSTMLEEMTAHSVKAAVNPIDVDVTPKPKPREAREPNVIDISEAEVITRFTRDEPPSGGVRPPRVRPVAIPPPNVHIL